MFVVSFSPSPHLFYFCDILTSNNILFGVMSGNLSFMCVYLIICMIVKYVDQSENST